MQADSRFTKMKPEFWAYVRAISQRNFSDNQTVKSYTLPDMASSLRNEGLKTTEIEQNGKPTKFAIALQEYSTYRADVLNHHVFSCLMSLAEAESLFFELKEKYNPTWAFAQNKQKGDKRKYAYLTGIVNILIEANSEGLPYDYNPQKLTSITRNGLPIETLARRVDGCFPSTVNPVAILEVKEYYHSTTYGSRVNGALVETLLDGMQLKGLKDRAEDIEIYHLLVADARHTLWDKGRPLLCRFVDALHEGYVDELLFGREVVERLPDIVREWVTVFRERNPEDKFR